MSVVHVSRGPPAGPSIPTTHDGAGLLPSRPYLAFLPFAGAVYQLTSAVMAAVSGARSCQASYPTLVPIPEQVQRLPQAGDTELATGSGEPGRLPDQLLDWLSIRRVPFVRMSTELKLSISRKHLKLNSLLFVKPWSYDSILPIFNDSNSGHTAAHASLADSDPRLRTVLFTETLQHPSPLPNATDSHTNDATAATSQSNHEHAQAHSNKPAATTSSAQLLIRNPTPTGAPTASTSNHQRRDSYNASSNATSCRVNSNNHANEPLCADNRSRTEHNVPQAYAAPQAA